MSCVVINGFTNGTTKSSKVSKVRPVPKAEGQSAHGSQKLQTRMPTPEQDFLIAVLFIFIALFMCYLPFFFYMLYILIAKHGSIKIVAICITAVLLNSSLNAIILVVFNKEMKRIIKAIFIK